MGMLWKLGIFTAMVPIRFLNPGIRHSPRGHGKNRDYVKQFTTEPACLQAACGTYMDLVCKPFSSFKPAAIVSLSTSIFSSHLI